MPAEQEALQVKSKTIVDFREISLTGSSIYSGIGVPAYNPDSLVQRKGLEIYRRMTEDDQVKAVITMKKYARLMTPWEIQPASQDAIDVEIADFVKTTLETMTGTFEDCLLNILTALEYGYSVTEKLWYRIEKGKFSGKIGLKDLKTREPFYYLFESDSFGNLRKDGVVYCGPTSIDLQNQQHGMNELLNNRTFGYRLPINKFIIYSYNKEFSNWYGKSDLRPAYRSWWSKEILIRFMNIYMERFGMPTHVGTYPKNLGKPDRDRLETILNKVQAKYSILVPEDVKIELLTAATGGEGSFRSSIEMHNKFISRSILVPDLMGFNEISGGSYALGKKHFDVFLWILQKLGRDIEETIVGEQIIKQLVDYNYSNVDAYPKFKFESITAEGTATRANIINMGVTGGFINPEEEWIRSYLSLPKADSSKPLGMLREQLSGGLELVPERTASEEEIKDVEDINQDELLSEEKSKEFRLSNDYKDSIKKWKERRFENIKDLNKNKEIESTRKFQKKINGLELDDRFDYKIDFTQMKNDLDEYESETVDELSKIIQLQRDALLRTVERKKIIETKDYSAVNTLQLRFIGDFKRELENRLIKLYMDAKLEALKEISKGANGKIEIITKFADVTIQLWIPVQPTEAIDFFNRKVNAKIVDNNGVKKLITMIARKELAYYDAKAFAISGIERDSILKKAKFILLEGLKSGDPKQTQFNLKSLFDNYLITGELQDGELTTPARLETIVRTNFSEAFNAGRKAMMDDPDLGDLVPYRQYKAIMDDRVRSTHAEMHNKIFKSDDPIWDEITPPNGYNCRCTVVGITKFDVKRLIDKDNGVDVSDDSDIPEEFPDQGFKQYAKATKSLTVTIDLPEDSKNDVEKVITSTLSELQSRLSGLENSIKDLNQITISRDSDIVKIQSERNKLQNQLVKVTSELSIKNDIEKRSVSLQSELDKLTKKNNQLQSNLDVIKSENKDALLLLGITKDNKDSKILDLSKEQQILQTQISSLQSELKDKNKVTIEAELLRKQVNDLTLKNAELENNINAMNSEKEKSNRDIELERNLLKSRIDVLTKDLTDYMTRLKLNKVNRIGTSDIEVIGELNNISRCPFQNCGSDLITISNENDNSIKIHCNECTNDSKASPSGIIEFYDKAKGTWVKQYTIPTVKINDVVRCPFPNCGDDKVELVKDNVKNGIKEYNCSHCKNSFRITDNGELYLYDKVKNDWIRPDMKAKPDYITGKRS